MPINVPCCQSLEHVLAMTVTGDILKPSLHFTYRLPAVSWTVFFFFWSTSRQRAYWLTLRFRHSPCQLLCISVVMLCFVDPWVVVLAKKNFFFGNSNIWCHNVNSWKRCPLYPCEVWQPPTDSSTVWKCVKWQTELSHHTKATEECVSLCLNTHHPPDRMLIIKGRTVPLHRHRLSGLQYMSHSTCLTVVSVYSLCHFFYNRIVKHYCFCYIPLHILKLTSLFLRAVFF